LSSHIHNPVDFPNINNRYYEPMADSGVED